MKNLNRLSFLVFVFIALLAFSDVDANTQTGRTKTLRFARGKSSAVLKGAVVRGTADRYIVAAKAGQTMSVKITSLEKNANFTVYFAGEQESLEGAEEATDWTEKLGDDNNYVIVVASVRGNATYVLTVAIK